MTSPAVPNPFAPVRALIGTLIEQGRVPSMAVAVARGGRIVWQEGFGLADRERGIRASAHTAYSVASLTKPITATAVMTLSEAGLIDIDRPIEAYLGIGVTSHAGCSSGVTARRIMAHSAGLPQFGQFLLDGAEPAGSLQTIERYAMTVFPPGTRFEYSNIGMRLLDAAIERVSGCDFGDYLRRAIFDPLGMRHSALGRPAAVAAAVRYDAAGKAMPYYRTSHPGSGDVWASAHDITRFLLFHMGSPLPGQRTILRRETVVEMQRAASAAPMPGPPGAPRRDVGACWILSRVGGHPRIWHSGGQPGTSSYMGFYPDQQVAVVVLANGSAPIGDISSAIMEAVAPEVAPRRPAGPLAAAAPIPFQGRWSGAITSHAGTQPLALSFARDGGVAVQLADQPSTMLAEAAFGDGALTGQFAATSNLPDARGHDHMLALKVVPVEGALVGQAVAVAINDQVAFMLPSFVRLCAVRDEDR